MIGINPIKIEHGQVKYEYTNKFSIRVRNLKHGAKGASSKYTSLDSYVHSLNQQEAEAAFLKREP